MEPSAKSPCRQPCRLQRLVSIWSRPGGETSKQQLSYTAALQGRSYGLGRRGSDPAVNHLCILPPQGSEWGWGVQGWNRAWFEDKNVSNSTIYPSISVPEQSLTGMGSPHSSLSSAQATLFGSVLSGSLEGGQRWAEQLRNAHSRLPGNNSWEKKGGGQSRKHLKAKS